jgi:NTP pyrophosphatase (non-canonical NTP hydrolase)
LDFQTLAQRAAQIRARYRDFETTRYGRSWTDEEIAMGFVGDVGDLMKLVQAKNGVRAVSGEVDDLLAHELADCLWCVLTLADTYNIDLEHAFIQTMDQLEAHLTNQPKSRDEHSRK